MGLYSDIGDAWKEAMKARDPKKDVLSSIRTEVKNKVISVLRSIAEENRLDWVEVKTREVEGTVRLQPPGRFVTLMKLVYEFEAHRCRLLLYREGRQLAGRCGIDYDDGAAIEQFLAQLRSFLRPLHRPEGLAVVPDPGACADAQVPGARRLLLAV